MSRLPAWIALTLCAPVQVYAESTQNQGFAAPPPVISMENMLQLSAGLLLVLALIGLIAWLFKKIGIHPGGKPGVLKIVTSTSIGQRERVVLTEIGDTWLVLGVAPGHVTLLHRMDKQNDWVNQTATTPPGEEFSDKLQASLKQDHVK